MSLWQYENHGYVDNGAHWLILNSDPRSQLNEINLRMDSQVYVTSQEGDTVSLSEVYKTAKGKPFVINSVGVWSPMSRLVMTTLTFWERRQNLGGLEFIVAALDVSHC